MSQSHEGMFTTIDSYCPHCQRSTAHLRKQCRNSAASFWRLWRPWGKRFLKISSTWSSRHWWKRCLSSCSLEKSVAIWNAEVLLSLINCDSYQVHGEAPWCRIAIAYGEHSSSHWAGQDFQLQILPLQVQEKGGPFLIAVFWSLPVKE